MNRQSRTLGDRAGYFGGAALLTIIGFVVAYQFIEPAPPDHIVMATGRLDGAYHRFAERYQEILARDGISLELQPSAGSVENLERLRTQNPVTDIALTQGGLAGKSRDGVVSLGSLYYEPLWYFSTADQTVRRFTELAGRRLAVGESGSGTRALALEILAANGISTDGGNLLSLAGASAAEALLSGEIDGVFLVGSTRSPVIQRLLESQRIGLMNVSRAEAYTRRTDYLTALTLPEGVVDLSRNIPSADVRLLATTANLVSRPDLHPALVDLLLRAAAEVHGKRGMFEGEMQFPSPELTDFPLSDDARRYYTHGPSFLQRVLPFWAANFVDRLKIMLLPFVLLLVPTLRLLPPIYRWRMRSRVYRWYGELAGVEERMRAGLSADQKQALERSLDELEDELRGIDVPQSYAHELYGLRLHLDLIRKEVTESGPR